MAFVEVFHCFGPGSFKKASKEFKVIKGVRTGRDVDNYFWSLAMKCNSMLSAKVHAHPDFFVINLDAMKYNPRYWLLPDGIHFNDQGKLHPPKESCLGLARPTTITIGG